MSHTYTKVQWNGNKKAYDVALVAAILLYIVGFIGLTALAHPAPNDLSPFPILLLRATSTCAFVMLHVILMIGPLARLDPRFLPLLYNRRHFGVAMFLVALVHGALAILFYHGFGNKNPLVSLLTSNTRYDSVAQFPFEILGVAALGILFLMAATSHDFWLKNLGAQFWKRMHMLVYVAYALIVMHVALGALQSETNPIYGVLLLAGVLAVTGVHVAAGVKEWRKDRASAHTGEWIPVGAVETIPMDRALIVRQEGQESIAVFRSEAGISALSNVCAHQGGPLGEGRIVDGCVTCPWHGYQYLADKGQSPPPFNETVPTYRVKLEGNEVWVNPNPLPPGTPVPAAKPMEMENS